MYRAAVILLLVGVVHLSCAEDAGERSCTDRHGRMIAHGESFYPRPEDTCFRCMCMDGQADMCMTAACAAPLCPNYKPDPEECCKFVCLDGDDDSSEEESSEEDDDEHERGMHGRHHFHKKMKLMLVLVAGVLLLFVVGAVGAFLFVRYRSYSEMQEPPSFDDINGKHPYDDLPNEPYYTYVDMEKVPIEPVELPNETVKQVQSGDEKI